MTVAIELAPCDRVIAEAAYEVLRNGFEFKTEEEHRCFRLKNLTKGEILAFLSVWEQREVLADSGIQLVVAADADDCYPRAYRADADKSITHYRNNISKGGGACLC